MLGVAAVRGCWGEPDKGADLLTVFEFTCGEELCGEDPGTVFADGAEARELVSDLGILGLAFGEQAATFLFDSQDLGTDKTEAVMLEEDPDANAAGKR